MTALGRTPASTATAVPVQLIAALYDSKTRDAGGLNARLAALDHRFFNHNGIAGSDAALQPRDEAGRLSMLHALERDLASLGLGYLGDVRPADTVLDAGCGAGGCALMIRERFGCGVDGVTLSPEQARFARRAAALEGLSDRVQFRVADMCGLQGARYAGIWACESTEHVADLDAMFVRFAGMLEPGARLVVIAWCAGDGPEADALKRRIDARYLTAIHSHRHYAGAAAAAGLVLADHADLTAMTVPYWRLRERSAHGTGTERFMGDGYARRLITYELFAFEAV
jgi:geranyl diphosphate 2-C-methyltransferase